MRFTSVNYYSSIMLCSWCFIGVHQDWHDVPCWSASNADRGFSRAVSEPVVSVSELDWYTSCILSVTDTCLYRNNRVISPGDFDIYSIIGSVSLSPREIRRTHRDDDIKWEKQRIETEIWIKVFLIFQEKCFFNNFLDAHQIHHFNPSYHYPTNFS